MMKCKCKTCGAVYKPIQDDGLEYYHVCSKEIDEPADFSFFGNSMIAPASYKKREKHRDENVKVDEFGFSTGVKSEGLGRDIIQP